MSDKVLVAYASRCGSTQEVAEEIGRTLTAAGASVEVRAARDVKDLAPYRAVVLGSAIRAGKWLAEATRLVQTHQGELANMPVAYFTVCLTMMNDTPESRQTVAAYLDPVRALVEPIDVGLFAGALDYGRLALPLQLLLRHVMKAPAGDFRNWETVRAWAASLGSKLHDASRLPLTLEA